MLWNFVIQRRYFMLLKLKLKIKINWSKTVSFSSFQWIKLSIMERTNGNLYSGDMNEKLKMCIDNSIISTWKWSRCCIIDSKECWNSNIFDEKSWIKSIKTFIELFYCCTDCILYILKKIINQYKYFCTNL